MSWGLPLAESLAEPTWACTSLSSLLSASGDESPPPASLLSASGGELPPRAADVDGSPSGSAFMDTESRLTVPISTARSRAFSAATSRLVGPRPPAPRRRHRALLCVCRSRRARRPGGLRPAAQVPRRRLRLMRLPNLTRAITVPWSIPPSGVARESSGPGASKLPVTCLR